MADIDVISPWPDQEIRRLISSRGMVPLVGAGVSISSKLPTGKQLARWLRKQDFGQEVDFAELGSVQAADNLLLVSQLIAATSGDVKRRMLVALHEHIRKLSEHATLGDEVKALAQEPGGLIVSLNYDNLIERAAREIGRDVVALGIDDIHRLIAERKLAPADRLHVLHLHGCVELDGAFVLTNDGYGRVHADARVGQLVAAVIMGGSFCIVGTRFHEPHLTAALQQMAARQAQNVIVCCETEAAEIRSNTDPRLTVITHGVVPCSYPDGEHHVVARFLERFVRRGEELAQPAVDYPDRTSAPYVRRSLLRIDGIQNPEIEMMFGRAELVDEAELTRRRRALVIGVAGSGKSELLRFLAANPLPEETTALVRLRSVQDPLGSAEAILRDWLAHADEPANRIDADAVIGGVLRVHLLLDGLDEYPPELRAAAIEAIGRVGDSFPQLRMTLTSRPATTLDELIGWQQFELRCDHRWREDFLRTQGTDWNSFRSQLGSLAQTLDPVLAIPFFVRRLAELSPQRIEETQRSGDTLGVVLTLLDQQVESDATLARVAHGVTRWLTDVALLMQLSGRRAIALSELEHAAASLELGDARMLAGLLAGRALLDESADDWGFGHRLFAEALIARHLLDQPPSEWLDIVAPEVFGRSALRDDWTNVFEMLAPRSPEWRRAVRERDPVAAARATPICADTGERSQAAWALWNRAERLQIWVDAGGMNGREDAPLIARLIEPGGVSELEDRIREALTSVSRYDRSNAMQVLLHLRPAEAPTILASIIADEPDSVVRRGAYVWAERLHQFDLAEPIIRRACEAIDESEASGAASTALRLVASKDRIGTARRMIAAGNRKVRDWEVLDGAHPGEQVGWLHSRVTTGVRERDPSTERLLLEAVGKLADPSDEQARMVGELAAIIATTNPDLIGWVAAHPTALGGVADALNGELVEWHEIRQLLWAADPDQFAAVGAPERVVSILRDRWQSRTVPTRPVWEPEDPVPQPVQLSDVLDEAATVRLLRLRDEDTRLLEEIKNADIQTRQRLAALLEELWGGRDLRAAITVGARRAHLEAWASVVLTYGPALNLPLSAERWVQAATCGWLYSEQYRWLAGQVDQQRLDQAARHPALGVAALIDLLRVAGTCDVQGVANRIVALPISELEGTYGQELAEQAAQMGQLRLLRMIADRSAVIRELVQPQLARAGDEDAQRAALVALRERLRAGERVDRHGEVWLASISDVSLIDDLVRTAQAANVHPRPFPFDVTDALLAAIQSIGGEEAISALESVAYARLWDGAQWAHERRDAALQVALADAALDRSELMIRRLRLRATAQPLWRP